MRSEEFYAHKDHLLNEVDRICEIMDNESKEVIDKITHEIIYKANKWREKNNLPRYKEQ